MEPEGRGHRWTPDRVRLGAAVACLAAAGASAGFAFAPAPRPEAAAPCRITAGGLPVDAKADAGDEARRIAQRYLRAEVALHYGSHRVTKTRARLGMQVDPVRLAALIAQAEDARSTLRRLHQKVAGRAALDLPMPASLDERGAMPTLIALADVIDRQGVPAHMDTSHKTLIPARDGRHLHVAACLDRLADAARSGATLIALRVDPDHDAHDHRALAGVSMATVIGEFETPYNASNEAADRTHNLEVAAAKIDGRIMLPGEVFDFNEVVGDRSEANGFRPAPQIADGELVDGVGGGACQIAGTLHAAAYFAGLPILERYPHSRPSSYIKMGLDAAVSYPNLDLRFQNDLPYPIVLAMRVTGGVVTAEIFGPDHRRKVTFERRITRVTTFDVHEEKDPDLPHGVRVLAQRGVPGFEVHRERIVEDTTTGKTLRDEQNVDQYPPTTEIWRVGTGDPPPDDYQPPQGDRHPEYVADEVLRMVCGPDTDGVEQHGRAGRYGTYGWMEREGLVASDDPGGHP